jgi:hypothetical protein
MLRLIVQSVSMLGVIMLRLIVQSVSMLCVIILSVIMLSEKCVIGLSVIMLSVIILAVVAPPNNLECLDLASPIFVS